MHSRLALTTSALLVAGASLVRASISISSACQSTLITIASSSEAQCLNVAGLAGLLTTSENSSVISPLNTWLTGACAEDACSNQTLSDIVSNITSGCSSDLTSLGIDSSSTDLTSLVQQAYPTVRKIACLKVDSNDTLCATDLLTEIENEEGTLSVTNIMTILPQLVTGGASNLSTYISCSDCVKEAYNVLQTDQPAVASNTTVTDALQSQCGSSFLDGSAVSDISEGTGTAAPSGTGSSTSGAAGLLSKNTLMGLALSSLAMVSSAFFILA